MKGEGKNRPAIAVRQAWFAVALLILLVGAPAYGRAPIRVGVYDNPPLVEVKAGSRPAGFSIDVLDAIAARERWSLDYVRCDWADCLRKLELTEIDLLVSIAYTETRDHIYDFANETLLTNWARLYAQPGLAIETVLDLDGRRLGVLAGDVYIMEFKQLLTQFKVKATLVEFPSYKGVFEAIQERQVDVGVVSRLFGLVNERAYKVEPCPIVFSPVEIRFAVPKGQNRDLLVAIDSRLAQMRADRQSIYYESLDDWLGMRKSLMTPTRLLWAIGALAVVALLVLLINVILRRQVGRRTAELEEGQQALEAEISERARIETELEEKEETYRALFEASSDAIFLETLDGRILDCNSTACAMYGCTREQMLALSVLDLVPEEVARTIPDLVRRQEQTGAAFVEAMGRRRDGSQFPTEVSTKLVAIRGQTRVVVYVRDMTDHKAVERALRKSEEKFAKVFHSSPDMVLIARMSDGLILDANRSSSRVLGYDRTELIGRSTLKLGTWEKPADREALVRRLQTEEEVIGFETAVIRQGGERAIVLISARVIDIDGLPCLLTVTCDITHERKVEEEKREMEIQLRQQQKLEAIGTLASGVAHEINNPINIVMNYAELIMQKAPAESPIRNNAREIISESHRIATIVRNLLAFARQERESAGANDYVDILQATLSLLQKVLSKDQIALKVNVPADLPLINCRRQQVQQVLMNLFTNARDALNQRYPSYDPGKQIVITVQALADESPPMVRTIVEDYGAGISKDIIDRIFDPFFTTKPRDRGTGLGLSVSHGIVKEHNGRLWVESEAGVYARFIMDLPVAVGAERPVHHGGDV